MSLLSVDRLKSRDNMDVNVGEAYHLWILTNDAHNIINHLKVRENFLHDPDFKYILSKLIQNAEKEIALLEKYLERINAKGPEPAITRVNTAGNTEVTLDRDIAWLVFKFMGQQLNSLILTFRDTTTNDELRNLFLRLTKKVSRQYYRYVDFLLLKDWIETPPLYPYIPPSVKEDISTIEIYHLWDHLASRNSNLYQTRAMMNYVNDLDFRSILSQGIQILQRQVDDLEIMMSRFGVSLPKQYSSIIPRPESTEYLDDRYIFNILLTGIHNASALHGQAVINSVTNKQVRQFFEKLLFQELNLNHSFVKYGKIKGWLVTIPKYKMQ